VVGILNPTDNQVTEWNAPTQDADIPDVYVVGTTFYFSERGAGKIGFLNPAQQAGTVKTAKVVVTPESPTVSLVTPTIATLKATTTIETPTVTNLTGTISGGFTEWTIPSSDSGPLGIVGQGGTPVFFSEYYGNKVAELTNSDPSGMLK
jgi:streptogramin lyase